MYVVGSHLTEKEKKMNDADTRAIITAVLRLVVLLHGHQQEARGHPRFAAEQLHDVAPLESNQITYLDFTRPLLYTVDMSRVLVRCVRQMAQACKRSLR